jgi:hypothetical protein
MQPIAIVLLFLVGLSGFHYICGKKRVVTALNLPRRSVLSQMRCSIKGNQEAVEVGNMGGGGLCITSLNSHFAEI